LATNNVIAHFSSEFDATVSALAIHRKLG